MMMLMIVLMLALMKHTMMKVNLRNQPDVVEAEHLVCLVRHRIEISEQIIIIIIMTIMTIMTIVIITIIIIFIIIC